MEFMKLLLIIIAVIIGIAFVGTVCSNKEREKEQEAQKKLEEEINHKRQAGRLED